jgi:hypothetical protein
VLGEKNSFVAVAIREWVYLLHEVKPEICRGRQRSTIGDLDSRFCRPARTGGRFVKSSIRLIFVIVRRSESRACWSPFSLLAAMSLFREHPCRHLFDSRMIPRQFTDQGRLDGSCTRLQHAGPSAARTLASSGRPSRRSMPQSRQQRQPARQSLAAAAPRAHRLRQT